MNERFFDELTRRVGDRTSSTLPRRGLVGLLGGSALASVAGLGLLTEDAEAKKKKKNKKKKDKGKGKDKGKCKADGTKCKKSKDCCDSKCSDGRCGSRCPTRVTFSTRWGATGDSSQRLVSPLDVAVSKDGKVYVTNSDTDRIKVFSEGGTPITQWGENGTGSEQFKKPRGIGVNTDNSKTRVIIGDPAQSSDNRLLRRFSTTGGYQSAIEKGQLTNPRGIAIDSNNRIWVVDGSSTGKVFLFDSSGSSLGSWTPSGSGALSSPQGIAVFKDSGATYVFVTNTGDNKVVKFEYTGNSSSGLTFVKAAGSRGSGSSSFNEPNGIAADTCGNLWVADSNNDRVQVLDKDLAFKTRFTASFNYPTGIAFGTNTKTLFIVDSSNSQVQKFSLSS